MAEAERRSSGAQGVGPLTIPPRPDGDISAEDRRRITGFYAVGGSGGGGSEPPPPLVGDAPQIVFARVTVGPAFSFLPGVVSL